MPVGSLLTDDPGKFYKLSYLIKENEPTSTNQPNSIIKAALDKGRLDVDVVADNIQEVLEYAVVPSNRVSFPSFITVIGFEVNEVVL